MTNDSKNLASLNKDILAALAAESKDALQKVMQQWSDSERECIEVDHQQFVQELIQEYDGRLKLQAAEIEHELYQKYLAQYNDLATTLGENSAMFLEGYAKRYESNEKNKEKPYYKIVNRELKKELETFLKKQEHIFDEGNKAIRRLTVEGVKKFVKDETHITELEQEAQEHIRETTQEWNAKREEKLKEVEKRLLNDTLQDSELITPFFTPKNKFTKQNTLVVMGDIDIKAPVAGNLLRYAVAEGASVKKGDTVIIIESMKMELEVKAPCDGKIAFCVETGTQISNGQTLAKLDGTLAAGSGNVVKDTSGTSSTMNGKSNKPLKCSPSSLSFSEYFWTVVGGIFVAIIIFFCIFLEYKEIKLHSAIKNDRTEKILKLIENDFWLSFNGSTCFSGLTALQYAIKKDKSEMVSFLIENGAAINYVNKNSDNDEELTPLLYSIKKDKKDMVHLLINKGAILNYQHKSVPTPLIYAIRKNKVNMVSFLIENGALVDYEDFSGMTPLMYAIKKNKKEIVIILLEKGANANYKSSKLGMTPLEYARSKGKTDMVSILMDNKMLQKKSDIPSKTKQNIMSLHDMKNETSIFSAIDNNNKNGILLLLSNGENINKEDSNGTTPLSYAIEKNKKDIVLFLIENGASVNQESSKGKTPLGFAVMNNNNEIASLLISKGADVNHKDHNWGTPLQRAVNAKNKNMISLLIDKGAILNDKYNPPLRWPIIDDDKEMISFLIDRGADVNLIDEHGLPVWVSAISGAHTTEDKETLAFLLENGVGINREVSGWTPLIYTICQNSGMISFLIEKGAKINQETTKGWTPLMWAINEANRTTVLCLIDNGADVNLKTSRGWTPLAYAKNQEKEEIVSLLIEKGAH